LERRFSRIYHYNNTVVHS